jgi:hypothetical protein
MTAANAIRTNGLMCLPKHVGSADNKFTLTHPISDLRCLTSSSTKEYYILLTTNTQPPLPRSTFMSVYRHRRFKSNLFLEFFSVGFPGQAASNSVVLKSSPCANTNIII